MEAVLIVAAASAIALVVNIFHPERIPWFAAENYETMVPCPIKEGHVTVLKATTAELSHAGVLVVDAREKMEYDQWHYPNALLLTYDFLDPIPEEKIQAMAKRIASERATRVIVYGDGAAPDTGKLLGIDISAAGINNVFYIKGGATSLKKVTAGRDGRLK